MNCNIIVTVSCEVKVDAVDNWNSIVSSTIKTCSILVRLPDLQRASPTNISKPSGNLEVIKRFESEKGRINDIKK